MENLDGVLDEVGQPETIVRCRLDEKSDKLIYVVIKFMWRSVRGLREEFGRFLQAVEKLDRLRTE
jgi:hypothetical protein